MAVNKNFVVKNGLEVDTNLILADATTNKVGIGTSVPQYPLHVFGGIGVTDSYVAGVSTIRNELNVGVGGTIFTVVATEAQDQFVGIRTANPAFLLDVRSPVSTGQTALYVQGDARITGNTNIEGDINIDEVNIRNLNVTGLSTFVGFATFRESVGIRSNFYVLGISTFVGKINNVGGGATIGNIRIGITDQDEIDTRENILVLDSAAGQVTVDDRLRVTGISTFDSNVAVGGTFGVTGFSTFADSVIVQDNFKVGGISTFVGVTSFLSNVDVRGNFTLAGSVSLDTDLYIIGVATIGNLKVSGLTTTRNLQVIGVSTFVGVSTFNDSVLVEDNLRVGGISTFVGMSTFNDYVFIQDGLNISGVTTISNTTNSTTFNNGALVIDGGLGVEKSVNIGGNLDVQGNVYIGGTTVTLRGTDVYIENKDIILGYTTSISPNDNTANHAGIAIASTEGSPLASFSASGINTLPDTYKQMMWFRSGTLGFSTDAFAFNYGVAIGTTTMGDGVRLAIGSSVTVTESAISAPSYKIGATQVISSGRELQNIASLDATTTATIEAAIANAPNTFTELKVTGVSTFIGIATFNNGIEVVSGVTTLGGYVDINNSVDISNNLKVSGITTLGITTVTQLHSTGIVTALSFRPTSGYYQAPDGTNAFYVYSGTGNVSFQGTYIGVANIHGSAGNKVVGLAGSDAAFVRNVSIAGVATIGTVKVLSGIITATSPSGIVTYYGDGSKLTGNASGLNAAIGIGSEGTFIGAGVTQLNFNSTTGTNITVDAATSGIATVTIQPGVSLGLAIALGG